MLERVERWIAMLPSQELNQPVLSVDGNFLTPNQILMEVRAGTELGRKAQALWESGALGTEEDMLKERLKARLERYPQDKPLFYTLGAPSGLTPKDLLTNIEQKTTLGQQWLETERTYLKYLDSLRKR